MSEKKVRSKRKVQFVTGAEETSQPVSSGEMVDALSAKLKVRQQQNDILVKSVKPSTVRRDIQGKYDQSKVAFSSKEYTNGFDNVENKGWKRLTDNELRELSQVDPYVSAIISTRCSQASVIGRPSDSKFDKGTRIAELDPLNLDSYDDKVKFDEEKKSRKRHMKAILEWVLTCGSSDDELINSVFSGMDPTFKKCSLADFVSAQVRNLLTFGRCGTQIIRNDQGLPVMFRPVPIETIYPVITGKDAHIVNREETAEESKEDAAEYNQLDEDERPAAYVQRIDGQNVNFLTEDELKVSYFQKQALFDLSGYPLAPIEQAIFMVYTHQQTLGYIRNQYVKGLGNKGILAIESTDPSATLSSEDLEELRRDFHNFVSRNDNSAATPVISGPVKINYLPLSANPKDMEFLQLEEHIIRALCSAMQTSPQEMGYGHLSVGQGGLTQANKQEEIVKGEERGLRMLLDIIYDLINEIVYENFPEAKAKYRVAYVGVGEDTRDAVVSRQNQELATTATLASLWSDSEKLDSVPFGGNVPLSPLFHQNVVRYMKYGMFVEEFFGVKGAASKPEYDFIIDPQMNQSYMMLKTQPIKMQQEGAALQLEGQEAQIKAMEAQMQQPQAGAPAPDGAPSADQPPESGPPQPAPSGPGEAPGEGPESAQKSLKDEYLNRKKLQKSESYYFSEWMKAHE
jgi:hypothetical protein